MILDPLRPPGYLGPVIARLLVDHTSWAVATYVMFRLALRARHAPLRQVLLVLGVLAVPLMALRFWTTFRLRAPARPNLAVLWFSAPLELMPLMAAAALGLVVVYVQRERDNAVLQA